MTYVFPRYPSWQHRQVRTEGMGQSAGSFPFFCHFLKFTDYKTPAARRRYARMHSMTVCTYNFSHIRVYEKVSVAYRHTLHTFIHFQQNRGLNDCNCVLTQVSTYGIIKMSVSNLAQQEENMEIDWMLAPWWAQWFAIDEDGTGWWYATKPVVNRANGLWQIDEKQNQWGFQLAGHQGYDFGDWEQSVRQRPTGGTNDRA